LAQNPGTPQGEDVYTACKTAMAELIMSGCTTTSDHLYIYPNDVMCACLLDCYVLVNPLGDSHC
jgi:cytosine/adenosine deaminase-related metal-dependent hydrolase